MATLNHIMVFALIFSLAVPVRAELTVKRAGRISSPPVVIIPAKKKEKKKREPASLIEWAKLNWVKLKKGKGDGKDDGKDGEGAGDGDGSGSTSLGDVGNSLFGSGKGKGAGAKTASGTGSNTFFDESAKKNGAKVDPGPRDEGDRKGPPKGPPGGPPDGIDPDSKNWPFYPMCLFVDAGAGDANAAVKGLVDDAAACKVNLVVFARTVQPIGTTDPDTINGWAQSVCNINEHFGVKASSVSTCVNNDVSAGYMCGEKDPPIGNPPSVAGCAQIQRVSGQVNLTGNELTDYLQRLTQGNGGGGSGTPSYGGPVSAPSIEKRGACDKDTIGHEAQGHSQWGHPNGVGDGKGIGIKPGGGGGGEGTGAGGGGWTGEGCQEMKTNAFPNDGRWTYSPQKTKYYFHETDPRRQISLPAQEKLWGPKPPPGTPPSQPPPAIADRGPGGFSEPQARPSGARVDQPPRADIARVTPDAAHPKKNGLLGKPSAQARANDVQAQTNAILANSPTSIPPSLPEPQLKEPETMAEPVVPLPPGIKSFGKGGTSNSIVFDEGAAKGGGAGSALGNSNGSTSVAGGASTSVTFDEGAAKGGGEKISLPGGSYGDAPASIGRTSRPPVIISGKSSDRAPASEEDKKKKEAKKKKTREFGDGLRKGSKVPLGNLYQAGESPSFTESSVD